VGRRLPWARRFGATEVIDASREDAVEAVRSLTGGQMIDFCVEAGSSPAGLSLAAHLPRRRGRLFAFGVPHH
jgi:threonine dehydrogenase-like Zn-dependent dehydrogenase